MKLLHSECKNYNFCIVLIHYINVILLQTKDLSFGTCAALFAGMMKNPYPTVRAIIVDRRDDTDKSELGEFHTISDAHKAIAQYRKDYPGMLEYWEILDIIDDEILSFGKD